MGYYVSWCRLLNLATRKNEPDPKRTLGNGNYECAFFYDSEKSQVVKRIVAFFTKQIVPERSTLCKVMDRAEGSCRTEGVKRRVKSKNRASKGAGADPR